MKQIKISNNGEIDINAFRLIGASSKRNDLTKIGYFGSGLKYAIAYLLRNNISFKCFSGINEIVFSTKSKNFRDQKIDVISINEIETSMTTGMGIDWSSFGMIREIYCNSIDEGNEVIETVEETEIAPEKDKTIFFIQSNEKIEKIMSNWSDYFSNDRQDLIYYDEDGNKLYTGGINKLIYRKGIQCSYFPSLKSLFHYDMKWIEINESRTIKNEFDFQWNLKIWFQKIKDKKIINKILNNILNSWEAKLDWESSTHNFSNDWLSCINNRYLVKENTAGYFESELKMFSHIILPDQLVNGLKERFEDKVKVMGEWENGNYKKGINKIIPNDKHKFLLKEVLHFFNEVNYKIDYEIQICSFDNQEILGQATDNTIFISEKIFDLGRKQIAKTIIEENEHLKTGFADETRQFQNHFIKLYLTQLEERYSYFL